MILAYLSVIAISSDFTVTLMKTKANLRQDNRCILRGSNSALFIFACLLSENQLLKTGIGPL